jgi:hypothetical protein
MLVYSFHADDLGDPFLRNVGSHKSHMASYPRRGILHHKAKFEKTVQEILFVSHNNGCTTKIKARTTTIIVN